MAVLQLAQAHTHIYERGQEQQERQRWREIDMRIGRNQRPRSQWFHTYFYPSCWYRMLDTSEIVARGVLGKADATPQIDKSTTFISVDRGHANKA
ncbi:hypothetical protein Tdes44962_MAKER02742 [Teratosphaeria destructans]|uniref:Uncharacterized protein n=1 Tax=Teratosphaeria destructans TaxID=418781 RepID=A0A9W7SSG9_9PEZI|nr:hypothetical protein Tdes44962_MAKER02742 [Teratosphaeria destructans]